MRKKNWMILKIIFVFILLVSFVTGFYLNNKVKERNGELIFINEPDQDQIFEKHVYILGEVKNPGVYEIESNTKLIDIVNKAGGFTENVNETFKTNQSELEKILQDNQKITIPNNSIVAVEAALGLINLNTATEKELMELSGIGESTAKKIIENRPYSSIEQLLDVSGIGDAKYEKIKDKVTI